MCSLVGTSEDTEHCTSDLIKIVAGLALQALTRICNLMVSMSSNVIQHKDCRVQASHCFCATFCQRQAGQLLHP